MSIKSSRPQPVNFSQEQLNQLREAFNVIDQNHSGNLDVTELQQFLSNTAIQPQFAALAIKLVDSDNDNRISFDEFLKFIDLINQTRTDPLSIYTRLFNLMDQDKSGLLDANEVKEFLNFFSNAAISDQQVQQFISMSDSDKDGKLSFNEIMKILGQ